MRRSSLFFGFAVLVVWVTGCFHPAVISPEPMPAGDLSLGLGVSGTPASEPIPFVPTAWLQARAGLGLGLDAGLRLSIPSGPYADIKWNFLKTGPWFATADIGASYFRTERGTWDTQEHYLQDTLMYSFYPALLFGRNDLFGGARLTLARRFSHYEPGRWDPMPGVLFGGSFGDQIRIMPGMEVAIPPSDFGVTVMVHVEAHTRSRSAYDPDAGW